MKLDKIITLANEHVQLPFLAMERSLRALGCKLPIWVIPYDNKKFNLPENCHWWEPSEIIHWLDRHDAHPSMRKYACLLEKNYHFIDTDCIFIQSPEKKLSGLTGFVVSCCHWHNPEDTLFGNSEALFRQQSSTWQKKVFNTGQFASDRALYEFDELKKVSEHKEYIQAILKNPYNEQPGLNLLVFLKSPPFYNLTLPPYEMESTWAGDYELPFLEFWKTPQKTPYIIHWAGKKPTGKLSVDKLFFQLLSYEEKKAYFKFFLKEKNKNPLQKLKQKIKSAWKGFKTVQ